MVLQSSIEIHHSLPLRVHIPSTRPAASLILLFIIEGLMMACAKQDIHYQLRIFEVLFVALYRVILVLWIPH